MVKLYKEQILFIIISLFINSILGYYGLSADININNSKNKNKYQKSLDSINFISKSLSDFSNSEYVYSRDIFNYKIAIKKKKKVEIQKKKKAVVIEPLNVKWVNTVNPYKKDKIEMILFMNGKAKLRINNKSKTYSVGEKVPIGTLIQRQFDIDAKKYTGKTRNMGAYNGKIKHITGRATYILSTGDDAFKLRPGLDPSLIKQQHIPNVKNKSKKKKGRSSSSDRKRERQ